MTDWTKTARRQHRAAVSALGHAVNRHSVSVPIGDSDATAPGYLCEGMFFSCVPDVTYPWDAAVLRAIRERIAEDAMPIVIRSVWRWSNYHELGHIAEPIVLVRHGMARAVRGKGPLPFFHCEMPVHTVPGLRIPGRPMSDCVPNELWDSWHDKTNRNMGEDLPGAYLPFDWDYYYALQASENARIRILRESIRDENADGEMIARAGAAASVEEIRTTHDARKASRLDDRAYINRDINRYHSVEPSDAEWRDANLRTPTLPEPKPFVDISGGKIA